MATIDTTKIISLSLDTCTIGSISLGAIGEDGAKVNITTDKIAIKAGNALGTLKHIRGPREASITMTLKQDVLANLLVVMAAGDTDREIPVQALSGTFLGSDGSSSTISGNVQFEENADIAAVISKESDLPIKANFVKQASGLLCINGTWI